MTRRRTFDRNFKLEILQQIEQKPMAEICREHGLHPTLVTRWKREREQYPKDAFRGRGKQYKLEAEIAKLQRHIGELYVENALLKKNIALLQERQAEERMMRSIK